MADFSPSDQALIVGLVLAAVVGTIVYIGANLAIEYLGVDPPPPQFGAVDNDIMLRNHESIQWIRDQEGRVSTITIDREVS